MNHRKFNPLNQKIMETFISLVIVFAAAGWLLASAADKLTKKQ